MRTERTPLSIVRMKGLGRAGIVVAAIFWVAVGLWNLMWWLFYGRDAGSLILVVLALLVSAAAAYCLGRAVEEGRHRTGLLWVGRALALAGAAFAVAFPATLYGEIVMLAQQGKTPTYDIAAAIWHEFWFMPLGILPALVALRWGRIAAVLMVVLTAYSLADGIYHFGGVDYYPEARTDLMPRIVQLAPPVLTAVLLFFGSEGWRAEEALRLPRLPLRPRLDTRPS